MKKKIAALADYVCRLRLSSLRGTKQSSALIVWIASFLAMTDTAPTVHDGHRTHRHDGHRHQQQ
ncbi:MAG: hypothetical protein LBT42_01290 [Tannerella sp.]|nr:hypothetical protein [Tannerella sp.]